MWCLPYTSKLYTMLAHDILIYYEFRGLFDSWYAKMFGILTLRDLFVSLMYKPLHLRSTSMLEACFDFLSRDCSDALLFSFSLKECHYHEVVEIAFSNLPGTFPHEKFPWFSLQLQTVADIYFVRRAHHKYYESEDKCFV